MTSNLNYDYLNTGVNMEERKKGYTYIRHTPPQETRYDACHSIMGNCLAQSNICGGVHE